MKILMVSMNSIHFQRWTEQLKDSGHEIHWFNIRDGGYLDRLSWVNQIVGWKQKFPKLKGRTFIKKRWPWLYKNISVFIENDTAKAFESALVNIKPDVVHSFVLYISCVPILEVMQKHSNVKWIYSSWGSDLFYFQHKPNYLKDIKRVLPRVDYLFTDCKRDTELAKKYGFKGEVLGVFPGGGGYPIQDYETYIKPVKERNLILLKGYQGRSGCALTVLKAINNLSEKLKMFSVVVFGADVEVEDFAKTNNLNNKLDITIYSKSEFLPQIEIIKLMGRALLYIGNSNSDGMPNTLLESLIMGAFPIQSNPGGASAEIINHNQNGLLISDFNSFEEVEIYILNALDNSELINNAFQINQNKIKPDLERNKIKKEVLASYNLVKK